VVPKPGSYQFSANASVREAFPSVLNYIKGKGYTRVGVIFSTDTTGQDAEHGLAAAMKDPAYKDLQIVATEHFAPGDISVTAQVEKIRSANPQILIAWTSGAPAGTVLRSVSQSAMGVPVIIGQANLSERAMSQFAEILPREMLIPGGTGAVRGDIAGVDARVNQAREAYFAKMDAAGVAVENSGENAWDAANVVIETLRKFGPGVKAADILKHISGIQERVGISGVYDFTKYPQRGLSGVELVMSRWNPQTKRFEAVSGRGGVVAQ
jgi:branched-chain amino acid transport system substrate-binding protein